MIIAIGGRMGSGKNTVCDIIQDLCKKNNGPDFEQKAFAGKLKQTASLLTGVSIENFEDQEFKKQNMPEEWNTEIWNDPDPITDNDYPITSRIKYEDDTSLITYNDGLSEAEVFDHEIEKRPMTYREFLQKLGTEAMRDGLHTNVWCNALFVNYNPKVSYQGYIVDFSDNNKPPEPIGKPTSSEYPNWIITDMRFPNEMEAVVKRHGITIRVTRPVKKSETTPKLHPSETSLDSAIFDYKIINDGSIDNLVEKVKEILIKEKLI